MAKCIFLLCTILVFENIREIASIKVYQTCKEIKDNTPVNLKDNLADGFYFIQLQSGIGIQVYCAGMELNSPLVPIEYINLPSGRSKNYGEFYKYVGELFWKSCRIAWTDKQ